MAKLLSVYTDVHSDYCPEWMIYLILDNRMATPHYVCADDTSYNSNNWRTYNTHHIRMVSSHSMWSDVCLADA
jgi:hypothetical protein